MLLSSFIKRKILPTYFLLLREPGALLVTSRGSQSFVVTYNPNCLQLGRPNAAILSVFFFLTVFLIEFMKMFMINLIHDNFKFLNFFMKVRIQDSTEKVVFSVQLGVNASMTLGISFHCFFFKCWICCCTHLFSFSWEYFRWVSFRLLALAKLDSELHKIFQKIFRFC